LIRAGLAALAWIAMAAPAMAQDHSAHQAEPDPHAGHDMTAPKAADPHAGHAMPADDSMADSTMDDAAEADAQPSPGPEMETPPPPEAGSGPPRAADAIWGADAMRASRLDLQQTHGDYNLLWFQADRAELQMRDGADGYLWDLQGYYGGTTSRFWFKSEGEGSFGEPIEDIELQALYSRAIAPFFDLQAGVRQDLAGPDTTYAVVGIQGLVPYMFEVDGALFLSHRGDITARLEAELDQRITQRLIVQPRAELNLSAQDIPQLGIGSGIDSFEVGVRLRYEIIREIAPYIGIEQTWRTGGSADFARARGEDASVTNYVVGIRFWF
jgi:copper resistance protein B